MDKETLSHIHSGILFDYIKKGETMQVVIYMALESNMLRKASQKLGLETKESLISGIQKKIIGK